MAHQSGTTHIRRPMERLPDGNFDEALEMGALLPEEVTVDVWRDWLRDPSCPEGYCPEGELREL